MPSIRARASSLPQTSTSRSPPTALIVPHSPATTPPPNFASSRREGALEHRATDAVLAAAGHAPAATATGPPPQHPGGLTGREAEVLRLAARGLTTQEIADRLYISAKTADHHIQHVYTKIGVSTRAAAALWAMQHALAG